MNLKEGAKKTLDVLIGRGQPAYHKIFLATTYISTAALAYCGLKDLGDLDTLHTAMAGFAVSWNGTIAAITNKDFGIRMMLWSEKENYSRA